MTLEASDGELRVRLVIEQLSGTIGDEGPRRISTSLLLLIGRPALASAPAD